MQLPVTRGRISATVRAELTSPSGERAEPAALDDALADIRDPLTDDDFQLALCMLYELHYQGFEGVDDELEWSPAVLAVRHHLEAGFESSLRARCPVQPREAATDRTARNRQPTGATGEDPAHRSAAAAVVDELSEITAVDKRPELSTYLSREGSREQFAEFLAVRSLQQLKEADAQTWLIPRLSGAAKAALVEIQIDEYGSGRPGRLHSELYATTMRACGLDSRYGAYLDVIPGHALAVGNAMTMLGLHRRLRGAAAGYFAAFEATSSIPSQGYADAAARLELPPEAALYFSEHVEADAVHEQLAIRHLCGGLVDAEPQLADDVVWGARVCMALEDRAADRYLDAWQAGGSCLIEAQPTDQAEEVGLDAVASVA